ncbi:hypothetical protein ACQJBY_067603 [Aegilops geniculata]
MSHSNQVRSRDKDDVRNPGNNLYVTGLSTRTQETDLEKFFSKEGKVKDCRVVIDPRTKESRGFAFVTMENVEDARRCIKYLHRTVLEGRLISVAKLSYPQISAPTLSGNKPHILGRSLQVNKSIVQHQNETITDLPFMSVAF